MRRTRHDGILNGSPITVDELEERIVRHAILDGPLTG